MIAAEPILRCRGVGKSFAGVMAVRGVDLEVHAGEVLAVVGANGAGKSTLMNIIAGAIECDEGGLEIDGKAVVLRGVRDALNCGIALVHQELNLADNLDVAANIALGNEPRTWSILNEQRINSQAVEWLARVGLDLSPTASVLELSMGKRQLVEIAKALSRRARVLILDEPTSSLSAAESSRLLDLMRTLADSGVAIVYITHRLDEVIRCAHRVVVMRDGACVAHLRGSEISRGALVDAMVGERAQSEANTPDHGALRGGCGKGRSVRLSLKNFSTTCWPKERVDLTVEAGEIVGLAGLVGAGRTELLRGVFGVESVLSGVVEVDGIALGGGDPMRCARRGVAMLPEDRQKDGLMLEDSCLENASIVSIGQNSKLGFIRRVLERKRVAAVFGKIRVRANAIDLPVGVLSGGNQQKVALSKWLLAEPGVLLLDEPSRGVDVAARSEIHGLIRDAAARGAAVLCAINDIEELMALCDRILVMHQGRIVGSCSPGLHSKEEICRIALAGSSLGERKLAS